MKNPTPGQILKAASKSIYAKEALKELYPELFQSRILPGQIYSWGTNSDGASGVVIGNFEDLYYSFVNFHTGIIYLQHLSCNFTKEDLNRQLKLLPSHTLHNCYSGSIKGPKHFRSWVTKQED